MFVKNNKAKMKQPQIYVYKTLFNLPIFFVEIWTKTPLPAAHVNSWSSYLRTTTLSVKPDSKLSKPKTKIIQFIQAISLYI